MKLTLRDQKLLEVLGSYGVLSTEQVAKQIFSGIAVTTVRRRLRILEKAKQIYRIHGLDSGGVAWALTKRKIEELSDGYSTRRFSRNSLNHDVTLNDVRAVLERTGVAANWVAEHVLKTRSSRNRRNENVDRFVPDAIFSVRVKDETKAIAFELELTGKHRKRYENILERYRRKSSLWAVWYAVGSESIGRKLESVWHEVSHGKRNDLLIWSRLDEILRDPWNARVRSLYFNHALKELITGREKIPALWGALPESRQMFADLQRKEVEAHRNHS